MGRVIQVNLMIWLYRILKSYRQHFLKGRYFRKYHSLQFPIFNLWWTASLEKWMNTVQHWTVSGQHFYIEAFRHWNNENISVKVKKVFFSTKEKTFPFQLNNSESIQRNLHQQEHPCLSFVITVFLLRSTIYLLSLRKLTGKQGFLLHNTI